MKLKPTDHVLTAYAQPSNGPGWSNTPIWVVIADRATGAIRHECIQPADQTDDMRTLYAVSAAAHSAMTAAVERARESKKRRKAG